MMLANILADFQFLDDWEDRYRYVIELGRALPPLPEGARTEANRVRGCASRRCAGRVRASRVGRALDAAALEWIRFDGRAHLHRLPPRHEWRGEAGRTAPTNNDPVSLFNLVIRVTEGESSEGYKLER